MRHGHHKMPDGNMMEDSEMKTYGGKSLSKGGGGRFARLEDVFANKGVKDPAALAAVLGRKRYGQKQMTKWAVAGRKRSK